MSSSPEGIAVGTSEDITPEGLAVGTPEDITPEDITPEDITPEDITPEDITPEGLAVADTPEDIDAASPPIVEDIDDSELDEVNRNEYDDFTEEPIIKMDNLEEEELLDFSLEDAIIEDIVDEEEILKRETEIIETDDIQISDYIDDVLHNASDYKQRSSKFKQKIIKEANNYIDLKHKTTTYENDKYTILKNKNYRFPLLKSLISQDYFNQRLIPIVLDSIKLYNPITTTQGSEDTPQMSGGAFDDKYFTKNFHQELEEIHKLEQLYNEFDSKEYNYYNKLRDYSKLINPEYPLSERTRGYIQTMKNDSFVLRHCDKDSPCHLYSNDTIRETNIDGKRLLGNQYNLDEKYNVTLTQDGQEHNIIGFLFVPTKYLITLNNFGCILNLNETMKKTKQNQYIVNILQNYNDDIHTYIIQEHKSLKNRLIEADKNDTLLYLLFPENENIQEDITSYLSYITSSSFTYSDTADIDIIDLYHSHMIDNKLRLGYTIKELNIFLATFDLHFTDVTYDIWTTIKSLLDTKNEQLYKKRVAILKKFRTRVTDESPEKNPILGSPLESKLIDKEDFKIINDIYDDKDKYKIDKTDSPINQLRWILKDTYRKQLFYLLKKIQHLTTIKTIFVEKQEYYIQILLTELELENKGLSTINDVIEWFKKENIRLDDIIKSLSTKKNTCTKIRKIYTSYDDLLADNRKTNIIYDDHLQIAGEENIVTIGDFALLEMNNIKQYFRRSVVGTEQEIWIKVSKQEYINQCHTNEKDCLFNEINNKCESRPLTFSKMKRDENNHYIQQLGLLHSLSQNNTIDNLIDTFTNMIPLLATQIKHKINSDTYNYSKAYNIYQTYKNEREKTFNKENINYLQLNGTEVDDVEIIEDEGYDADGRKIVTRAIVNEKKQKPSTTLFKDIEIDVISLRDQLLSHISEEDSRDNKTISIRNILNGLIDIINIPITSKEMETIINDIETFSVIHKQTLTDYISSLKRIKSFRTKNTAAHKKYYIRYIQKYTILWTACRLLIYLQTAIPNIKVKNIIKSCKMNFMGFPLIYEKNTTDRNKNGIQFMTCILHLLENTGNFGTIIKYNVYYRCTKKKTSTLHCQTIPEAIEEILELFYENYSIQLLYENKRKYISTIVPTKIKKWSNFRPTLIPITIDIKPPSITVQDMIESSLSTEKIRQFKTFHHWMSLYIIQSINEFLAKQSVDNSLYNPTPLGNSSGLYLIDENYTSQFYYSKNTGSSITSDFNEIKQIEHLLDKDRTTHISVHSKNKKARLYSRYHFSEWEENDELTQQLFTHFVYDGIFIGSKHFYNNRNISMITGKSKEYYQSLSHEDKDKSELKKHIKNKNIIHLSKKRNENKYQQLLKTFNIVSVIDKIALNNNLLSRNTYFQKFHELFKEYILNNIESDSRTVSIEKQKHKLWNYVDEMKNNMSKNIQDSLSECLSSEEIEDMITMIDTIGLFNKIYDENVSNYESVQALYIRNKSKNLFIQYQFLTTLRIIINKIVNHHIFTSSSQDIGIGQIPNLEQFMKNIHVEPEFKDLIFKEHERFKKYTDDSSKNTIFKRMSDDLIHTIHHIEEITSKETIKDCNDTVIQSLFDSNDSNFLLTFLLHILLQILLGHYEEEEISDVSLGDEPLKEMEGKKQEEELPLGKDVVELQEKDINIQLDSRVRCEFLKDFLDFIFQSQKRLDTLTHKNIMKNIEQREEELKERNLRTYRDLNKEAQIIQKELLKHKLDKWSNLATKTRSRYAFQQAEDAFSPDEDVSEHLNAIEESNIRYVGEEDEDVEW